MIDQINSAVCALTYAITLSRNCSHLVSKSCITLKGLAHSIAYWNYGSRHVSKSLDSAEETQSSDGALTRVKRVLI